MRRSGPGALTRTPRPSTRVEHIHIGREEADVLLGQEIRPRQERDSAGIRRDVAGDHLETERQVGAGVVGGEALGRAVFEVATEDVDRLIGVASHEVARARAEDDEPAVRAHQRAEAVVVALDAVTVPADEPQRAVPPIEDEHVGEEPVRVAADERRIGRFEPDETAVRRNRGKEARCR